MQISAPAQDLFFERSPNIISLLTDWFNSWLLLWLTDFQTASEWLSFNIPHGSSTLVSSSVTHFPINRYQFLIIPPVNPAHTQCVETIEWLLLCRETITNIWTCGLTGDGGASGWEKFQDVNKQGCFVIIIVPCGLNAVCPLQEQFKNF